MFDPRFVLQAELGSGSFGAVVRAFDRKLGREVALKVIQNLAPEDVARFMEESRALVRVDDPGVVRILDVGTFEGRPWLAMELVPGETLESRLRRGPFELREAARIGIGIARTLEQLHAAGVVHRDLKPANVMVRPDGHPVLLDLGLALLLDRSARLSRSGDVIGTPAFMSPEQALGRIRDMGPAADVYGLGATLYALLTGRPPFDQENTVALLERVIRAQPRPPSSHRAGLGKRLDRVVLACLAKDPLARPDLRQVIAALSAPDRAPGSPRRRAAALAIASVLALLGAAWVLRPGPGKAAPAGPTGPTEETIAMVRSGDSAYLGLGVPKDPAAAAALYRRAAEAGDPDGMASLGALYIKGEGVPVDPAQAERLLRSAIERGNGRAMCNLAALYEDGSPGFPVDLPQAVALYLRSAEAGWPNAMVILANLSFEGKGVPKSDAEGVRWLSRASDAGLTSATLRLMRMLEQGRVVKKDPASLAQVQARAVQQLTFDAEQGDPKAMVELGHALFRGRGVARDVAAATRWWKRALESGDTSACYWLGVIFFDGRDLERATAFLRRVEGRNRPYAALYLHLIALERGDEQAGLDGLSAVRVEARGWPAELIGALLGERSDEELLALAGSGDPNDTGGPTGRLCVATFYLGARHLLGGDAARGRTLLRACVATGVTDFPQHGSAQVLLAR